MTSAPAARPQVSAPTAEIQSRDKTTTSLFITVRPGDEEHLRQFMDRRLRVANVFLRSNIPCFPGQPIDVAVVHPKTDAEVIVSGTIARVVHGESERDNGFLLRFDDLDPDRKKALVHFVNTGHPQTLSPDSDDVNAVEQLRLLAEQHPKSLADQLNYAWALLTNEEAPIEAIEPFLAALSLAPTHIDVHLGLSLAYALAGDDAKSYAFARSSRQLAAGEAAERGAGNR